MDTTLINCKICEKEFEKTFKGTATIEKEKHNKKVSWIKRAIAFGLKTLSVKIIK